MLVLFVISIAPFTSLKFKLKLKFLRCMILFLVSTWFESIAITHYVFA